MNGSNCATKDFSDAVPGAPFRAVARNARERDDAQHRKMMDRSDRLERLSAAIAFVTVSVSTLADHARNGGGENAVTCSSAENLAMLLEILGGYGNHGLNVPCDTV